MYVAADGDARIWLDGSAGNISAKGASYSPIYYDYNNTAYFMDPASTSRINVMDLEGTIRHNGDTNTYMQFHAADQWRVVTGGSERLEVNNTATKGSRIDATSQMRSPIYYDRNNTAYYIHGDSTSVLNALTLNGVLTSNSSQTRDKLRVWTSSSYTIGMRSGYTYGHLGNDYAMSFQMNNSSSRGFWWGDDAHSNAQGAMSLTTNGRLTVATSLSVGQGEGITSPSTQRLYVSGTGQATSDFRAPIFYDSNNTGYYVDPASISIMNEIRVLQYIRHQGDTNTYIRFIAADDMQLVAGGRQMIRMDEGPNPDRLYFPNTSTYTDSNGNIVASGNVTAYASDERLKTNVEPIKNAIKIVSEMTGVFYDWKDEVEELGFTPDSKEDNVGVIAQEIQKVLPQVVKPAPFDRIRNKETGWKDVSKSGEEYLTVDYDKIVPVLIEAIKEQQKRIESLENTIKT